MGSLFDFVNLSFEHITVSDMNMSNMFAPIGDGTLTMAVLFFISRWIFDICVSLGRKGWK